MRPNGLTVGPESGKNGCQGWKSPPLIEGLSGQLGVLHPFVYQALTIYVDAAGRALEVPEKPCHIPEHAWDNGEADWDRPEWTLGETGQELGKVGSGLGIDLPEVGKD